MALKVDQVSQNEVVVCCSLGEAFPLVARALQKLGKLQKEDRPGQYVSGVIMYGLQSVKVRVSLVERDPGRTNVVIQASSDDVWGAGAKHATKRLIETLRNLDNPGYAPDRLGIHPAALLGAVIGFVFLLLLALKYVVPLLGS